ncbi:hypothetical protein BFR04_05715 [Gaetbulibacter sp. 4G1]|nr:glycosyltransferase family 4 protein [Gaetbulibacter sp. 4G1]PIA79018.1 hypothetical protein BFR04_05715 [Gaetbulibacter sp. 4G1]
MKKILFIGNIPDEDPKSIGGANTYTSEILREIRSNKNISLTFLKIRKRWYKFGQIFDYTFFPFKFMTKILKQDIVSIHATWDFHLTLGPFVVLVSKLFGKKVVYHFFGGKFHQMYQEYPLLLKKWLNITIFRSDFKLMETQRMINYFESKEFQGMIWFPNSRRKEVMKSRKNNFSKKFVFISRVTPTKGIDYIVEAAKNLPDDYLIHIYGPLDKNFYNETIITSSNLKYMGILSPKDVVLTLVEYDVLLLPSFHNGEGYPGIFIEAMSVGLPIISTDWNSLDELVEDGFNGLLVKTKNSEQLLRAIKSFSRENYCDYSNNAKKKFKNFNIDEVIKKLFKLYFK